jgi:membrane-associated PAP2 superfamily phosphatase
MTPSSAPRPGDASPPGRSLVRFYLLHLALPLAIAALLLALFESYRIDFAISERFYDRAARDFPMRSNWFFEVGLHTIAKIAVILFGIALLWIFLASFSRPRWRTWRRPALYVVLCLCLGPLLIAELKERSCHHCPWHLSIYGGVQPYFGLLESAPPGATLGKCFPSGHASGGFALMSIYFALRLRDPKKARAGLVLGLVAGLLLGLGRVAQGAHFVSHVLASGLFVWLACLVLYELVLRRAEERSLAVLPVHDPGPARKSGVFAPDSP